MSWFDSLKSLFSSSKLDVRARFELLREGISGTMSKFYMARERTTKKIFGLKILDKQKTAAFEARFPGLNKPTEGEIAIQFDHPSIVKTFEYGLTTDGAQYTIMEYLEGGGMNALIFTQDDWLQGRRLRLLRQVAEALDVVHKMGFIHRDVCPRNFILTADRKTLKLTDFGLSVPATDPFMMPGNRTGTPNYMAPELVRRRRTDPRLDVFAFGVSAYEILTFELPWMRGSTGQAAMTHDQPPTDITEYRPHLNRRWVKAIHACIEPNLDKRCPSMEHFLNIIRDSAEEEEPETSQD